jgi:hypothetical protein
MPAQITMPELIEKEARDLARQFLEKKLLEQDLPLPRDSALEIHIGQILEADPTIRARAKARVEAKQDAFSMSLAALGIEREIVDTTDFQF